jgi:galactonate dehydratase
MFPAVHHRRARLHKVLAPQAAVTLPAPAGKLQISSIDLFPVREPRFGVEYSVVRVRTKSGLIGFGEGALASSQDVTAARNFWIGRPATSYATAPHDIPLSGAMDMAMLDILGKSCNAPVYRVLGGPTRNKARALASLNTGVGESMKHLKSAADAGYRAFGLRIPSPTARNQGQAYQIAVRKLVELVRAQGGDFVLEGDGLLTPGDAASVAAGVQMLHPLWFDEPCAIGNLQTLHKITDESVVPLGFGRDVKASGDFQELLRAALVDVVRPDLHHFGLTRTRRIAALAETYYVAVAPRHTGGPIATAAALHLAASLPNFFIQSIPYPQAAEDRAMRAELAGSQLETVKDGFASLPAGPGLGISVNERMLEKYHAA